MIDPTEAAIRRKRGHDGHPSKDWRRCKWCGTWFREVRTLEEREDAPPESEQDQLPLLKARLLEDPPFGGAPS
jgi:hypothetical protein